MLGFSWGFGGVIGPVGCHSQLMLLEYNTDFDQDLGWSL